MFLLRRISYADNRNGDCREEGAQDITGKNKDIGTTFGPESMCIDFLALPGDWRLNKPEDLPFPICVAFQCHVLDNRMSFQLREGNLTCEFNCTFGKSTFI